MVYIFVFVFVWSSIFALLMTGAAVIHDNTLPMPENYGRWLDLFQFMAIVSGIAALLSRPHGE